MTEQGRNIKWGAEKRLEFIDFRLYWEGAINRADIMDQFGVSVPQASKDLSLYQEKAPANLEYDKSEKRYFASSAFQPVFYTPDANAYLTQLRLMAEKSMETEDSWLSSIPSFDIMPIPDRQVSSDMLRQLIHASNNKLDIEIKYQSMNPDRPKPVWRWITPHALCNEGLRWHMRSYCHIDNKFKDFLLSRIMDVRGSRESEIGGAQDKDWNEYFDVVLIPNPALSEDQQKVIAQDYGMKKGAITIPVRYSVLYYLKRRLRLDVVEALDKPQEAPVIIKNREAFEAALSRQSQN